MDTIIINVYENENQNPIAVAISEIKEKIEVSIFDGKQGDKGDQGIQGLQGDKGDKGDQGIQGLQGDKGDKGDQGIQGLQGDKGDKGDQGIQGLQGDKGDKGDQGIQGSQGIQGLIGPDTNYYKLLYVDPNGNDTSGTKGAIAKPFLTIEAAVSAASSGDMIIINPGAYTVTSNLAKNGVVFFYCGGTIVTKTTSGAIFDYSTSGTYTSDINILGYGNFNKTSATGEVFNITNNTNAINTIFEYGIISATHSAAIYTTYANNVVRTFVFKGQKVTSSGSYGMYISTSASSAVKIDCPYIGSTSTDGLVIGAGNINIKGSTVISSVRYGVQIPFSGQLVNYDVSYTYGPTAGILIGTNGNGYINVYGYVNKASLNCNSGYAGHQHFFGEVGELVIGDNGANVFIETLRSITGIAYSSNTVVVNHLNLGPVGSLVVNNGEVFIRRLTGSLNQGAGTITISGTGTCIIDYASISYVDRFFNVTGGKLYIKELYGDGSGYGGAYGRAINQSGGIVQYGRVYASHNSFLAYCHKKTGGTLILNGAELVKANTTGPFIYCPNKIENILIYSGGVITNGAVGSLLSGRKQKYKVTITAVAQPTTIKISDGKIATITVNATAGTGYTVGDILTLIDLGGNINGTCRVATVGAGNKVATIDTIVAGTGYIVVNAYLTTGGTGTGCKLNVTAITSETFTSVINTSKIDICADLVALINASATLGVTATDNLDGTFNIESDVAGVQFITSGLVNCTVAVLMDNSYALNNVLGATNIVENSNVV
jgi:hypothetical protein